MSKKRVLTIGGAMRDLFLQSGNLQSVCIPEVCDSQPFIMLQEGRKIEVESLEFFPGGGAVNSAFSFAKQGHAVDIFCKVGSDSEGDFVRGSLQREGVGVEHMLQDAHAGTGISIIIPCVSGNRAVLVYRGANAKLSQEDISAHLLGNGLFETGLSESGLAKTGLLKNLDLVYITSLAELASQALPAIAQEAKRNGALVAVNPGTSQLTKSVASLQAALPNIDILIMNKYEASLLMSAIMQTSFTLETIVLEQFFTEILKLGPRIAVVTNDKEGVYVAAQAGCSSGQEGSLSLTSEGADRHQTYFQPSVQTHIISTLGAGDAFGSTFSGHILDGASIPDAMRAGVVNAASVLSSLGANTGLLSKSELGQAVACLDPAELQISKGTPTSPRSP